MVNGPISIILRSTGIETIDGKASIRTADGSVHAIEVLRVHVLYGNETWIMIAMIKTHLITHRPETGKAVPIKQRHYIVSPYVQKEIIEEIDRLLGLDVIESSEPGAWLLHWW